MTAVDMSIKAKVGQKGNTVFFYMPTTIADGLNIHKGDTVDIWKTGNEGHFRKSDELTLEALVASVPEDYDPSDYWSEEDIWEAMDW